jgi:hypothetical protein
LDSLFYKTHNHHTEITWLWCDSTYSPYANVEIGVPRVRDFASLFYQCLSVSFCGSKGRVSLHSPETKSFFFLVKAPALFLLFNLLCFRMKLFYSLFYGSTIERETTMMKRAFIFVLALALFIAITGGYGQIINSDWVARSFISADQNAEEYPQLKEDVKYSFYMNDGRTYTGGNNDNYNGPYVGFVVEQKGKWVTLTGDHRNYDGLYGHDHNHINLDNVCRIQHYEKIKD